VPPTDPKRRSIDAERAGSFDHRWILFPFQDGTGILQYQEQILSEFRSIEVEAREVEVRASLSAFLPKIRNVHVHKPTKKKNTPTSTKTTPTPQI
jgi:hypothetical protein